MKAAELVQDCVRFLLAGSSGITAIVANRIRPQKADQKDPLPYIVYRKTNDNFEATKDGNTSLSRQIIEVEIYAASYNQLIGLATLCRQRLDGQGGAIDGHDIKEILYLTSRDDYQDAASLDGVYMIQQDYLIFANTN